MRIGDKEGRSLPHHHETRWWLREMARFETEAREIYSQMVEPKKRHHYDSSPYNLTLRAYVMHCFSWIDLASQYYSQSDTQTKRMEAFLRRYMEIDGESAHVVVNLWRHTLAHGPFPRARLHRPVRLTPTRSCSTDYWPNLAWQTAKDEHLRIRMRQEDEDVGDEEYGVIYGDGRKARMMTLGLFNLIADSRTAIEKYVMELDGDERLQAAYDARWEEIAKESFA
jgi:hypothetical protein